MPVRCPPERLKCSPCLGSSSACKRLCMPMPSLPWGSSGWRARWRCAASGRPTSAHPSPPRVCRTCAGSQHTQGKEQNMKQAHWWAAQLASLGGQGGLGRRVIKEQGRMRSPSSRGRSHPLGRRMMKLWALEALAASIISSWVQPAGAVAAPAQKRGHKGKYFGHRQLVRLAARPMCSLAKRWFRAAHWPAQDGSATREVLGRSPGLP
jgi:hypothetical protein